MVIYMKKPRRLLIDDCRNECDLRMRFNVIARDYWEGVKCLFFYGYWDEVYLDHDLESFEKPGDASTEKTGYDIIKQLELSLHDAMDQYPGMSKQDVMERKGMPKKIVCVSSNPAGRANIEAVVKRMYG